MTTKQPLKVHTWQADKNARLVSSTPASRSNTRPAPTLHVDTCMGMHYTQTHVWVCIYACT